MEETTKSMAGTSEVKGAKKPKAEKKTIKDDPIKQKPTMIQEVCAAIEVLGLPKKGASAQSIKKHILSNYEEHEHARINTRIKKAFVAGIETGLLKRPAVSKDSTGATGRFLLAKKTEKRKVSKKTEAKDAETEELVSDSETTIKPRQKARKRNVSDKSEEVEDTGAKPKSLKVKNATSKNLKKNETKTVPKKEKERKDASDSEVVVKKKGRKSLKSYSSDTELMDFVEEKKTEKKRKLTTKDNVSKKAPEEPEQTSTTSKAKGSKKLFRGLEKDKKDEIKPRTRAKKPTA